MNDRPGLAIPLFAGWLQENEVIWLFCKVPCIYRPSGDVKALKNGLRITGPFVNERAKFRPHFGYRHCFART
jgi:hypothetical protein